MWSGEIPHPTADSKVFTALCSAKPGALPQMGDVFLVLSVGSREEAGSDMDSRGLDREHYGQTEEPGTMVSLHWLFDHTKLKVSHCRV